MSPFSIFPVRASAMAAEIDALYGFLVLVSSVMTGLIFFFIFYFAIKYRRRSPDERPRAIRGSLSLEIAWSVIPFLFMLIMFAWGTKLYFQAYSLAPPNTLDIYITGKQWMWKVQYPDGQQEINELHLPTGRPVKLTLASEDVIHSFFLPAFRLKRDVVPGNYESYWLEANKTGRSHIFCAEYCGTNHSQMVGWVTAMEPAEYEQWLASGTTGGTLQEQGQRLFEQYGCASCHVVNQQGRCPSLRNVFGGPVVLDDNRTVTADENYIRESILNPNAKIVKGYKRDIMPVFQGQISEEGLIQLIAYIKSLASPAAPARSAGQTSTTKGKLP